jgi:hypothetical protein
MENIALSSFKTHYKAVVIKIVWYWYKGRHIDTTGQTESPETNPHNCGQLVFDKGIQWIKDLNVKPKTIDLLEK